ncbi:MAG: DNA polymerase III subunit beta [Planctomycetaceae bacterium]|jgi:DNA polymerase-3 subunit beta|nr:DNA polymerase III subunit beta [Planctomycetaceae bacterium]
MKISCERNKFSQSFQLAAAVASVRDVRPILQNVKITVDKSGVLLQATDTELGIRIYVEDCSVAEKGEAILPTKLLKKILVESDEEELILESSGDKTIVSGSRSKYTLFTQPVDEFTDVESFGESAYHEIPANVFSETIRRTTFATDTDNAKYALSGVFFELLEDRYAAVATDGRRLAFQEGAAKCVKNHKVETSIFPVRTLQVIERAIANSEEPVKLSVSPNRVLIQHGKTVFYSRLLEGRFPRWRSIIPNEDGKVKLEILAAPFAAAIKQAATVTIEKQPGVTIIFEKGKMITTGSGHEVGDSAIETPVAYDGKKKLSIKIDPKYLIEHLRVLPPEQNVKILISDEGEPLTLKTDDEYIYVVMPLSA